jgi:hypothetical protein
LLLFSMLKMAFVKWSGRCLSSSKGCQSDFAIDANCLSP